MKPTFKRTRLWVDPAFQFRLLLRMSLYLLFFTVFVVHIGFIFQIMMEMTAGGVRKEIGDLYLDFLEQQKVLLFSLVLVAPILLYDLLKFSNRIAGPLFRCRQVMNEMASGKPAREFVPRKRDLMAELFQAFNGLIVSWNARVGANVKEPSPSSEPHLEKPEEEMHPLTNGFAEKERERVKL